MNHMKKVAQMFGKELGERVTIIKGNKKIDARFKWHGLELMDEYENPYISVDAFVLRDLLIGRAEIVEDKE